MGRAVRRGDGRAGRDHPFSHDYGLHVDLAVGAISSGVGALSLTLLPLEITTPMRRVRGDWGAPDRCALLQRAEHVLIDEESDERVANGPLGHVGNVVTNAAIAAILGFGYHRWSSAAISGGVGLVVGEVNAFTQPHHLAAVRANYRAGALDPESPKVTWSIAPMMSPEARGMALILAW